MSEKNKHEVKIASSLVGNLVMIAIVIVILGGAMVWKEYLG